MTRMASSSVPSLTDVFGPRLPARWLGAGCAVAAYTLDRATRQTWQIQVRG
jgi:hypothetical protein